MQTNNTIVILFAQTFPAAFNTAAFAGKTNVTEQECSQKGDSGCASEKLGVPHLLSD